MTEYSTMILPQETQQMQEIFTFLWLSDGTTGMNTAGGSKGGG